MRTKLCAIDILTINYSAALDFILWTDLDHCLLLFIKKLRRKCLKNKGHVYQTSACNVSQSRKNQTAEQSRRDSESAKEVISNQTVSSNYLIYFFTFKELF